MLKIDYIPVVRNFENERIILASWPKREHDLQKWDRNLAGCRLLNYGQCQEMTEQCLQSFVGRKG